MEHILSNYNVKKPKLGKKWYLLLAISTKKISNFLNNINLINKMTKDDKHKILNTIIMDIEKQKHILDRTFAFIQHLN